MLPPSATHVNVQGWLNSAARQVPIAPEMVKFLDTAAQIRIRLDAVLRQSIRWVNSG
jgi:hypothetical protein